MNIDNLNKALKYSRERLPVSAIHPELRFTCLGAVLREHATEPSDIGELAYQALTSDHTKPLELMPLHLLRDKMQEEPDHPLAKQVDWAKVPEHVAVDQSVEKVVGNAAWAWIQDANRPTANFTHTKLKSLAKENGVKVGDIYESLSRLNDKQYNELDANQRRIAGVPNADEEVHQMLANRMSGK
jgi:hypothetical protein